MRSFFQLGVRSEELGVDGGRCPYPIDIVIKITLATLKKELQAFHYVCLYFNPKAVRLSHNS